MVLRGVDFGYPAVTERQLRAFPRPPGEVGGTSSTAPASGIQAKEDRSVSNSGRE